MNKKTKGVIYIATGEKCVNEALVSAASLKRYMPDLPVTLFSDIHIASEYINNVVSIKEPTNTFEDKIRNIYKSPYDYTLYLDADTYICDDFSELFDLLDNFDIAAAHNYGRRFSTGRYSDKAITTSFPTFNCGVILFKKSVKTRELFSGWLRLYLRNKRRQRADVNHKKIQGGVLNDQHSFREAVYESDARVCILARNYNLRCPEGFIEGKVKIIHYRRGPFGPIAQTLNAAMAPRIYLWRKGKLNVFEAPKFNSKERKRVKRFIRTLNAKCPVNYIRHIIELLKI